MASHNYNKHHPKTWIRTEVWKLFQSIPTLNRLWWHFMVWIWYQVHYLNLFSSELLSFECLLDLDYLFPIRFVSVRAIDDRVFLPNYKVNPLFWRRKKLKEKKRNTRNLKSQTETGMLGPQYKPYRPNPRPWLVVIEVSKHYDKSWCFEYWKNRIGNELRYPSIEWYKLVLVRNKTGTRPVPI